MLKIVLIAVTGELGVGKTLTLAYLLWNNWYFKKRKIYSNITIYGIPFCRINSIESFLKYFPKETTEEEILNPQERAFGGDEFWKLVSSRMIGIGARKKNEIINSILMASRKKRFHVYYTTQLFSMIDKNIRQITDLLMKPQLSVDKSYTKLYVFGIVEGKFLQPLQPMYFINEPIYAIYNTYEVAPDFEIERSEYDSDEEIIIPITKNPAWKVYLRDTYGIQPDSDAFFEYSKKVAKGLGLPKEAVESI